MACMQAAISSPISSNPALHVYTAVFPIEWPVNVTCPLAGLVGLGHRAKVNA